MYMHNFKTILKIPAVFSGIHFYYSITITHASQNTVKLHFFVNISPHFDITLKLPSGFSSLSNIDIIIH